MKAPIFLFLLALTLRLAAIAGWRFDGLYGQDSFAYFRQALAIAANLPLGRPPPVDFFWPNGYPLLVAAFTLVAGQTAWAGQLASLLCGALLAPLAYQLSRDLFPGAGRRAGVLAGLIVAVAGQPILSSVVVMADMPALFWAALAARLTVRAWQRPRPAAWLWGAGAALALAIVTRWLYVLLAPALVFYSLYEMSRLKARWWQPAPAVLGGFAILAPQVWLSLNRPAGLFHSWLLGWRPLNFVGRQFDTLDGRSVYDLPVGVFYAQPAGHPAYIFPLLGLAAAWGLWRLWQTRNWGALILLLGWLAPVYLFLAGIPYQNFRFGLTHYLPLVLLTAFGWSELWASWERGRSGTGAGPVSGRLRRMLWPAVTGLCLLGMLLWAYPMLNSFLAGQNRSKEIARQAAQRLPDEATLLAFGLTLTLQHYTPANTLELFYLDERSLPALASSTGPLYLLVDPGNLESQWAGKQPFLNYRWLQEHPGLTEIERFPPYILYRVGE